MSAASASPSPLDFLVTPEEAVRVQRQLVSMGVPIPPPSQHTEKRPHSRASNPTPSPPTEQHVRSINFWLQDENLPKTIRTALRSALLAASINSAIETLATGVRRKRLLPALRRILSPISFRLFTCILLFSTLYRSLVHALVVVRKRIALTKGRASIPAVSALIASAVALNALPSGDAFPVASIAMWILTHSLCSLYNEGRTRQSRLVRWIPSWCDSSLLYAIGNGQLLWAFLFENDTFPRSYGSVILTRSSSYIQARPADLPPSVEWPSRQTISDHVAILATPSAKSSGVGASAFPSFSPMQTIASSSQPSSAYSLINPILDYSPAHPSHKNLMCAMLHPTEPSCRQTLLNHFKAEWLSSARFAGLFAALASLLFRHRAWARSPESELFKVGLATLQGATLITGSIGTGWAMTCFLQRYLPGTFLPRARFFLNGFVSGIFILAVPKSRRKELGLYVARMSAASTWKILSKRGKVQSIPRGPHALLAVALAILAGLYEVESKHVSKAMGGLAARVYGERMMVEQKKRQQEE